MPASVRPQPLAFETPATRIAPATARGPVAPSDRKTDEAAKLLDKGRKERLSLDALEPHWAEAIDAATD